MAYINVCKYGNHDCKHSIEMPINTYEGYILHLYFCTMISKCENAAPISIHDEEIIAIMKIERGEQ